MNRLQCYLTINVSDFEAVVLIPLSAILVCTMVMIVLIVVLIRFKKWKSRTCKFYVHKGQYFSRMFAERVELLTGLGEVWFLISSSFHDDSYPLLLGSATNAMRTAEGVHNDGYVQENL